MAFGNLGSLVVKIETDLTNLNAGLREAEANLQKTSGSLLKISGQIGRGMTIAGAAITGTFALATKAAIDYEDAFAGVRKTVDASEKEFAQLSANFRKLATEIPISAVELAKIGEIAGQLGIRGVDNLTKFTKTIALMGSTTNISGEAAALALSRFMKVMGSSQADIERVGATIVGLGNNFAARESEIVDLSVSLASFGRQINLSAAETLAFATVIKSVGGEAQAASSAFQKLALKIKDAVITSNEDLEKFADIAGVTADEFAQKFREDASGALADFLLGLNKIEEAGGSTSEALGELGLADIRLIREIGKVIGANEDLRIGLSMASNLWEENNALTIEAEKRFKTTASQLKLLVNNVVELGIKIGDVLIPIITPLIEKLKLFMQQVGDFIQNNPKFAQGLIEITAVFGLMLLAIGPLLIALPGLVTAFNLLGVSAIGLVTSLSALAVAGPAAFVGWKIGRLIGEFTGLDNALSGQEGVFTKMFEWIDKNIVKLKELGETAANIATGGVFGVIKSGLGFLFNKGGGTEAPPAEDVDPAEVPIDGLTNEQYEEVLIERSEAYNNYLQILKDFKDIYNEEDISSFSTKLQQEKMLQLQHLQEKLQQIIVNGGLEAAEVEKIEKKIAAIKEKYNKIEEASQKKTMTQKIELWASYLSEVSSALNAAAAENKKFAKAAQVVSMALIVMRTASGAMKAYEDWGWPLGLVAAGLVIAAGAIQLGVAAGALAEGTDTVPAMLSPGEMVVPSTFAAAIRRGDLALSGGEGSSGMSVTNYITVEAQVSNDIDMDDLAGRIGENIEEKLRRIN